MAHNQHDGNRRSFLLKAGLAAGVAWTAPVILSTPASAQTSIGAGTYRAQSDGTLARVTPANGGGCSPSVWNGLPDYPDTFTATDTGTDFVFTIAAGTCVFQGGRANGTGGGECQDGVLSNGDQTLTFPKIFAAYAEFRAVLIC